MNHLDLIDDAIIISPHMDDAFFSMGGTILELALKGKKVKVINVFSDTYFSVYPLSESVEEVRKNEELSNTQRVISISKNTSISVRFMDLPDALVRGHVLEDQLDYPQKRLTELDEKILKVLKDKITNLYLDFPKGAVIFVPLGIGEHIDHLMVRDVAVDIFPTNVSVIGYEEQPYVALGFGDVDRNASTSFTVPINWSEKEVFIRNYPTQIIPDIEMIEPIKLYACSLSSENIASERFVVLQGGLSDE